MNILRRSQYIFAIFILLLPFICYAAVPSWQILPNESSITFTGTQNGAPASGNFKKFSGVIHFDPDHLNDSTVRFVIDMNSVTTSYSDFTTTLITEDWFNVKLFPEAIFESSHFTKTGDNKYQAAGTLTIRDKTIPVTLSFDAKPLSATKVLVQGNTVIKRTQFGVGQGEWGDTDAVKDDVLVNFSLTALKN